MKQKKNLDLLWLIFIIIFCVLLLLITKSNYIIDDAFITFRYATNLAAGHGIVWNLHEQPTQGYTNFLFLIVISLGLKLLIDPQTVALILNIAGLVIICLSGDQLLMKKGVDHRIRLLFVVMVFLYPITIRNAFSGLETVFWSGLLFYCLFLVSSDNSSKGYWIFIITISAATLTRPESLIFALCWFILFFYKISNKKTFYLGIFTYGILTAGFCLFNFLYFGSVLPNSALIKVGNPFELPGVFYFLMTLTENIVLAVITILVLGLVFLVKCEGKTLYYAFFPFALLIPFYLFTDPLMGMYSRFYFATIIAMTLFSFMGFFDVYYSIRTIKSGGLQQPRSCVSTKLWVRFLPYFGFLLIGSLLATGVSSYIKQIREPYQQPLLDAEIRIGKQLKNSTFVDEIYFAYGDAGSIPYFSGVRFLDLVGLNNTQIAQNGRQLGGAWIIEYILNQEPDIIGFYTTNAGNIFNAGHGVIGAYYSDLYRSMIENNLYGYIGSFECGWININFFVANNSNYKDEIHQLFRGIEGFTLLSITP